MDITEYIPYGKDNAVTRKYLCQITKLSDREMRKEIAKARRVTPILNSQDGKGYYQPNKEDYREVEDFIRQESKRAKSIFYNLKGAKDWIKSVDNQAKMK